MQLFLMQVDFYFIIAILISIEVFVLNFKFFLGVYRNVEKQKQ